MSETLTRTEAKVTCRYCGHEAAKGEMRREGLPQCRTWSCKDEAACGARLRQAKSCDRKTRGVRLTEEGWLVIRVEKEDPKVGLVTTTDAYRVECRGGLWQLTKTDGTVYRVRLGAEASCNCPDHTYRRRACKHILGLQALQAAGRLN